MMQIGQSMYSAYTVDQEIVFSAYTYAGLVRDNHVFDPVDPLGMRVVFKHGSGWEEKLHLKPTKADAVRYMLETVEMSIRWWQKKREKHVREIESIDERLDDFAGEFFLLRGALSSYEASS
jgi:hypothetical protein